MAVFQKLPTLTSLAGVTWLRLLAVRPSNYSLTSSVDWPCQPWTQSPHSLWGLNTKASRDRVRDQLKINFIGTANKSFPSEYNWLQESSVKLRQPVSHLVFEWCSSSSGRRQSPWSREPRVTMNIAIAAHPNNSPGPINMMLPVAMTASTAAQTFDKFPRGRRMRVSWSLRDCICLGTVSKWNQQFDLFDNLTILTCYLRTHMGGPDITFC